MKKIISFLLASVMTVTMSITAFAKTNDDDVKELHVFAAIINRDENRAYIGITDSDDYLQYLTPGNMDIAKAMESLKMDAAKLNDLKVKAKITEGKQSVIYNGFGELHGFQFVVLAYANDRNIEKKQHINLELSITNKNGKEVLDKTKYRIKMDDTKNVIDEKKLGIPDSEGRIYGEWDQKSKEATVDLDALNANKEIIEDMSERELARLGIFLAQGKITTQGNIAEYENLMNLPYNFMRVVDFDKAEEIELESDMFTYTTSASKQGKVSLAYNNKGISAIEAAFPEDADLYFFNFPGHPEFDFTGKATISLPDEDKEWTLYQVSLLNGTMTPVPNAVLNEDGDCLEFKTRKLTNYVLADVAPQLPKTNGAAEVAPKAEAQAAAATPAV